MQNSRNWITLGLVLAGVAVLGVVEYYSYRPSSPPRIPESALSLYPAEPQVRTDREVREEVKQSLKIDGKMELAEVVEVFEESLKKYNEALQRYDQAHESYANLVAAIPSLDDPRIQAQLRDLDSLSDQLVKANRVVTEVSQIVQNQYRTYALQEIQKYR